MTMSDASSIEQEEGRRPRFRSRATRAEGAAIAAIAALAAVLLVLSSDAAPTGIRWLDAAYLAGAAAATTVAGSRARRWSILVSAAIVAVGAEGLGLICAIAALGIGMYLAYTDRRSRITGAIAGALVVLVAGSLRWPVSPHGASTVLAILAILPLWRSGYLVARRNTRRALRRCALGAVAVGILGIGLAAILALTTRSTLTEAVDESRAAAARLSTGGGGEQEAATFRDSQNDFESVASAATSWWVVPARLVPVVSQHVAALGEIADAGAELAGAAAAVSEKVDYDRLQLPDGGLDVAELASFRAPADNAAAAVAGAQRTLDEVDSPWLLSPVRSRLVELDGRIAEAATAVEIAAAATRDLPGILGADGPKRYLLLLGNPAESRDLGGHIGSWAELRADNGKFTVERSGTPYELFTPVSQNRPVLRSKALIPASLSEMDPTRFMQNWGASPDLAAVATLATDLYPQVAPGPPLDGVIYADPAAFAALLSVVGPVQAGGVTVDADNAVEFLTAGQFTDPAYEEAVSDLVETALDKFTSTQLPSPRRLADVFGPVIERGQLQFVQSAGRSSLLELTGLDVPVASEPGADTVMVLNRNAVPSKIDTYLQRTIDYIVDWNPADGSIRSRLVITMKNEAPAEGLPAVVLGDGSDLPPGTNRTQLAVLTGLDPVGAMVDGETTTFGRRADVGGMQRLTVPVTIGPGATKTVIFDLEGDLQPGDYRLRWYSQPLVRPDMSRLIFRPVGTTLPDGDEIGALPLGSGRLQVVDVETAAG